MRKHHHNHRRTLDEKLTAVGRIVIDGQRQTDVCKQYGYSSGLLSQWVKQHRDTVLQQSNPRAQSSDKSASPSASALKVNGRFSREIRAQALQLIDAGAPNVEIARQLGVPDHTISYWKLVRKRDAEPSTAVVATRPSPQRVEVSPLHENLAKGLSFLRHAQADLDKRMASRDISLKDLSIDRLHALTALRFLEGAD